MPHSSALSNPIQGSPPNRIVVLAPVNPTQFDRSTGSRVDGPGGDNTLPPLNLSYFEPTHVAMQPLSQVPHSEAHAAPQERPLNVSALRNRPRGAYSQPTLAMLGGADEPNLQELKQMTPRQRIQWVRALRRHRNLSVDSVRRPGFTSGPRRWPCDNCWPSVPEGMLYIGGGTQCDGAGIYCHQCAAKAREDVWCTWQRAHDAKRSTNPSRDK